MRNLSFRVPRLWSVPPLAGASSCLFPHIIPHLGRVFSHGITTHRKISAAHDDTAHVAQEQPCRGKGSTEEGRQSWQQINRTARRSTCTDATHGSGATHTER